MSFATMRAVDISPDAPHPPPASSLYINHSIPRPVAKPNECLIRVKAFGLNRADTLQRVGLYPLDPSWPKIMGLEFSGIIEEVGSEPRADRGLEWKVGDEVFGLAYGGCYAEFVAVHKRTIMKKPEKMSWGVAAGIPEVWFTSIQALYFVGNYSPTQTRTILWHAAASAVSIAGIQLSLAANSKLGHQPPRVYATARQDAKCSVATSLGATAAINTTTTPSWSTELKRLNNGKGVDLVIDFLGASAFAQNLDVLALDGCIVQLGLMGGMMLPEKVDISAFVLKRIRLEGSTLRTRDVEYQGRLLDMFEENVLEWLVGGQFKSGVETIVAWDEVGEMHGRLERNETKGKIVCLVD
ncbi:chaperonin 10-like protein [Talaromyces proteolyticus]|uniref:Chaperonin 10-like protein n=1 Tax=Talaromyces proteolyticus TaxID=1131652 RepID=A0AAD4Q2A3_9EURO|nr:chaperonin 10-like protein [Talaromyces proteolyticus]KAH8703472.1 chaperonin 10-like protein [Talaromyces proteolyticus]